jgi:hypothetical protein
MSWGEALRLATVLAADPSSQVGAALAGWQYPATRADLTLRDLVDITIRVNAKRPPSKAYPRPSDPAPKRIGRGTFTREEFDQLRARQPATTATRKIV